MLALCAVFSLAVPAAAAAAPEYAPFSLDANGYYGGADIVTIEFAAPSQQTVMVRTDHKNEQGETLSTAYTRKTVNILSVLPGSRVFFNGEWYEYGGFPGAVGTVDAPGYYTIHEGGAAIGVLKDGTIDDSIARGTFVLCDDYFIMLARDTLRAVPTTQHITVNGNEVSAEAYNIGGANYFKLRDLGSVLGFHVNYDAATRTVQIVG